MIESNDILNAVIKEYDQSRLNAEEKAYNINAALENDRQFSEINSEYKNAVFSKNKAEYENNLIAAEKYELKIAALKAKRLQILQQKGYTEDSLKPQYSCALCSDSGFTPDGKYCACFNKRIKQSAENYLDISPRKLPSFSQFVYNLNVKDKLEKYAEKFASKQSKNLIISGATGTGKTFSAGCIANAVENSGKTVIFVSAFKLCDIFLKYHTARGSDKKIIFDVLTTCDLLVIDDLGSEPLFKNVSTEYLNAFISERIDNGKTFIITTNLSPNEINARYTERLLSRLSGETCLFIGCEGEDLRRKHRA